MSNPEFTAIPTHPCVRCGAHERYKSGRCGPCARANAKAWVMANPGRAKAKDAAWQAANPDKRKAMWAAWQAQNIEHLKTAKAAWNTTNRDRIKVVANAWRAANRDLLKKTQAARRAANPEAHRIHNQNRRALRKENGGKLSKGLAARLFNLQKGKCACCKQPLGRNYHLDHIMPIALGGANVDSNIQLLRQRCNNQKSTKHPIDFMQERGFLL